MPMTNENFPASFEVNREGDKITLVVAVPQQVIKQREEQLLREIAREVFIPGFRPGMAPRHLVLARYGEREFEEELKDTLIREWLGKTLDRAGLDPATAPHLDEVSFEKDERLHFQVSFEVLPEIEIPDELPISIPEPPPAEVSEEELSEALEDLKRRAGVLEPKEAPAEAGDIVRIAHGDQLWEAEIDPARPIGKQLLGTKSGAKIVLKDEEGHAEEFEVVGVYRLVIPADEEVAAYYGEESWEAVKEKVREQLLERKEAERLANLRLAALDALADHLNLEPPPGLTAEIVEEEMRELKVKPELRGEVEGAVRRRLRREILARRIAEQKGLLPSAEEVAALAEETKAHESSIRARRMLDRAADWIREHARRDK